MAYLKPDFFERDVLTVARDLIGVELEWQGCSGIIVETEAYAVEGDLACHTASRPSARDFVLKQPPGHSLRVSELWHVLALQPAGQRRQAGRGSS